MSCGLGTVFLRCHGPAASAGRFGACCRRHNLDVVSLMTSEHARPGFSLGSAAHRGEELRRPPGEVGQTDVPANILFSHKAL